MRFPFSERQLSENRYRRVFDEAVDSSELIWHRDREDRIVKIIEGKGWGLQLDNQMPFMLQEGKNYVIPKEQWHRVIKGDGKLIIEIQKVL
jgi:quercetin dioxygenase-like cupin family protein